MTLNGRIVLTSLWISLIIIVFVVSASDVRSQGESGPIKIKVRRIEFKAGNQYAVNIPDLAFHLQFQKSFETIKSSITADYDYRRKDMGFGMSHVFTKYEVNPGISVDDNLFFRRVFNDSTGVWSRKQSVTPFLMHEYSENVTIGLQFKFENEWAPKRRMGTDIIYYRDNSINAFYTYQSISEDSENGWDKFVLSIDIERSYKIFHGEYNYMLLDTMIQYFKEIRNHVRYKGKLGFHGNLTPQNSPLFFIGGDRTLIGYENDEFWGRKALFMQNLFEYMPSPDYTFNIGNTEFRKLNAIVQIDFGRVKGGSTLKDLKPQTNDIKTGIGLGFGINTDLPYMPQTDLYFIVASPSDRIEEIKYYAGFGGWLQ